MLSLIDSRWNTYIGGYQVPYDASKAIRQLLEGPDRASALAELENELCHQGDLGSASYAALPWLVEYVRAVPNWTPEPSAWC